MSRPGSCMQSVSPFDAALVCFEACEWLGPLSAQRLAEQLRTTGRAGFRVGSALTDLVETLREVVVSERLPPERLTPRWRVGVLQHGTAQEAGREWEDAFGYGGPDSDESWSNASTTC